MYMQRMTGEKCQIKYCYEEDIERWLIISGGMAQEEKSSMISESFYDLNAVSDWHFDFSPRDSTAQEASYM